LAVKGFEKRSFSSVTAKNGPWLSSAACALGESTAEAVVKRIIAKILRQLISENLIPHPEP
jgi:hypothetical protein